MQQSLQIGKTTWICVQAPDKQTIDDLASQYNLHEMIVSEILDTTAQSKIDISGDHFSMALTFTKYLIEESRYTSNEMVVIIGEDFIITTTNVESEKMTMIFDTIRTEAKEIDGSYKSSPYYILYRIIDAFYDKIMRSLIISSQKLLNIQTHIDKKWDEIIDELISEDLNKIFLKHNFLSQEEILDELAEYVKKFHEKHLNAYFNDLRSKLAKINRTINVLMEKNDSLMNAHNTLIGIRSNKSITRLTFINSIFMPLALIASIWWMSERSMMTWPENRKISYPLFIILCIVLAYITFLILRRFFMTK